MLDLLYWFTPWEESAPVFIATVVVAVLFLRGCARSNPRFQQRLYFWTGLAFTYLVSHTQFDYYAEHQFFIHRLQHLVLHHLGPFLIVLSSPLATLRAGMPEAGQRACRLIAKWKPVQYLFAALCNPVVAVTLFCGLIGFWLLPIHDLRPRDRRVERDSGSANRRNNSMDSRRDDERNWHFDCGARGVDAAKILTAREDAAKAHPLLFF